VSSSSFFIFIRKSHYTHIIAYCQWSCGMIERATGGFLFAFNANMKSAGRRIALDWPPVRVPADAIVSGNGNTAAAGSMQARDVRRQSLTGAAW
jgi:hypothetical protein